MSSSTYFRIGSFRLFCFSAFCFGNPHRGHQGCCNRRDTSAPTDAEPRSFTVAMEDGWNWPDHVTIFPLKWGFWWVSMARLIDDVMIFPLKIIEMVILVKISMAMLVFREGTKPHVKTRSDFGCSSPKIRDTVSWYDLGRFQELSLGKHVAQDMLENRIGLNFFQWCAPTNL